MMQRITDWILRRDPPFYAVRYVEPDGSAEIDIYQLRSMADDWARWCREDGCTEVEVRPFYVLLGPRP